jgi:hypothetical protein
MEGEYSRGENGRRAGVEVGGNEVGCAVDVHRIAGCEVLVPPVCVKLM